MDSLEATFLVSSWIEGNAIRYQLPSPSFTHDTYVFLDIQS